MEHHIVQPVVAVHQAHRTVIRRHIGGQPLQQRFHGRYVLCFRGAVLLAPAIDLAFEIIARATVVAEAHGRHVDIVQRRHGGVHGVVDRRALGVVRRLWQ